MSQSVRSHVCTTNMYFQNKRAGEAKLQACTLTDPTDYRQTPQSTGEIMQITLFNILKYFACEQ